MNIHIVVVAHSLADDLERLFEAGASDNVTWHLFLHSAIPAVEQMCQKLIGIYPHVYFYPYKVNRGLSKSWNEGLIEGYRRGADVVMIANDDAIPRPGDVQILGEVALEKRDYYMITGAGFDVRDMQHHKNMKFSLAAINPIAVETIGYFDENIFPIYWEDVDWYRRAALAGLKLWCVEETCIIHMGSRSVYSNPELMRQNHETFHRNREYYERKWGGPVGHETLIRPFGEFSLKIDPA
ncbi:MAG: hypothetical protein K8L99_02545, partial [Anaerolineae bacterium]|nr:hypothetical protein [Anaerolineae bacterium]